MVKWYCYNDRNWKDGTTEHKGEELEAMGQHVIKLKSMLLILREVKEHTACKGLSLHPGIVAKPLISRHAASHQALRLPVTPMNDQVSPD